MLRPNETLNDFANHKVTTFELEQTLADYLVGFYKFAGGLDVTTGPQLLTKHLGKLTIGELAMLENMLVKMLTSLQLMQAQVVLHTMMRGEHGVESIDTREELNNLKAKIPTLFDVEEEAVNDVTRS